MFSPNRTILTYITTSLVTTIIVLLIAGGIIINNKRRIFEYFAAVYDPIPESNDEKPEPPTPPFSQEATIIEAVQKSSPAVISIVVTKDVPIINRYYEEFEPFSDFFGGNFFGPFMPLVPREQNRDTERREIGGGTAFIVSADGLAVTNRHVVSDTAASYTAFTSDGEQHEVSIVAKDPVLDIAVLKIKGGPFKYLNFGNSDQIKVGQTAIAIGNALGEFKNTVSVGVISGLYRSIVASDELGSQPETLDEVIQTDAAINPGNSGGPLLDTRGRVIGVNVAVVRGSENIGFALPINAVRSIVDSVAKHGKIIRPHLGIRYIQITDLVKQRNNLTVDYGVLVQRGETREELAVIPGSPANKAGIVENDIILEIDGTKLENDRSLASIIRNHQVGDKVILKILHQGQTKNITVTLEQAPIN